MWLASHPTVPDFSCGFQPHLSSGTRSSVVRVFFVSVSNAGSIDCPMVIEPPRREEFGVVRPEHRRIKSELSSAFLFRLADSMLLLSLASLKKQGNRHKRPVAPGRSG